MVLGLVWNKKRDTLSCNVQAKEHEEKSINKRNVLSILSQVYDPLAFTCPTLLQPKLMIQSSWSKEISSDEQWNEENIKKFKKWQTELPALKRIEIPRVAVGSDISALELHLFTEASQDAYAAVVYARVNYGE